MSSSEFARKQLEKHGWKKGSGLGKQEHGRCDPIKVNLKMDKTGVGHDPGKEFTDHWWLRVFNDAAKKIGTKQKTKKKSETEKKLDRKQAFYAGFIKSATLTNGVEEKEEKSESSSSEDESSEAQSVPTLNDIHQFCGGATGHKAARFGIKMGGKLSRVAKHDQMVAERLKESSSHNSVADVVSASSVNSMSSPQSSESEKGKKMKKKKREKSIEKESDVGLPEIDGNEDDPEEEKKKKRGKRKKRDNGIEVGHSEVEAVDKIEDCNVVETKKKKKKEKKKCQNENDITLLGEATIDEGDVVVSVKKEKKKSKQSFESSVVPVTEHIVLEQESELNEGVGKASEIPKIKKKKKDVETSEEGTSSTKSKKKRKADDDEPEKVSEKKKKRKKNKHSNSS